MKLDWGGLVNIGEDIGPGLPSMERVRVGWLIRQ